jgi:hypothetical protein
MRQYVDHRRKVHVQREMMYDTSIPICIDHAGTTRSFSLPKFGVPTANSYHQCGEGQETNSPGSQPVLGNQEERENKIYAIRTMPCLTSPFTLELDLGMQIYLQTGRTAHDNATRLPFLKTMAAVYAYGI